MATQEELQALVQKRKKKLQQRLLLAITGLVFLAILSPPTVFIVVVGMVPTWVALITVPRHRDLAALTMGPLNAVSLLPPIFGLWRRDQSLTTAIDVLFEPFAMFFVLAASAVGAACFHGLPPMIELAMTYRSQIALRRCRTIQEKLVEEWGDGITERPASARRRKKKATA